MWCGPSALTSLSFFDHFLNHLSTTSTNIASLLNRLCGSPGPAIARWPTGNARGRSIMYLTIYYCSAGGWFLKITFRICRFLLAETFVHSGQPSSGLARSVFFEDRKIHHRKRQLHSLSEVGATHHGAPLDTCAGRSFCILGFDTRPVAMLRLRRPSESPRTGESRRLLRMLCWLCGWHF